MTHEIIQTKDYLLVVNDSEIKEGEIYFIQSDISEGSRVLFVCGSYDGIPIYANGGKKVIAHLPLNGSPILEGLDLLPPIENEVEELAEKEYSEQSQSCDDDPNEFFNYPGYLKAGFIDGYNKAKEKYKYTEEDISIMVNNAVVFSESNTHLSVGEYARQFKDFYDKCIQSLNLPEMPVAFECEIEHFYMSNKYFYVDAGWVKCDEAQYKSIKKEIPTCPLKKVHKEITTPEGHTQWVGKYVY